MKVSVAEIIPNPKQPRKNFDPEALQILADSLDKHGLIQAITVEERPEGGYQLIAGERRWRAAQMNGWKEIEATVIPPITSNGQADQSRLTMALVENVHRENMDAIETGEAYQELHDAGMSDAKIAEMVGKSTSNIWLYRAILRFHPTIREYFREGRLGMDQNAVYIFRKLDPAQRLEIITTLVEKGAKTPTIVKACKRALNGEEWKNNGKLKDTSVSKADKDGVVPSIRLGARGGFKWDTAYQAAVHTCKKCDFFGSSTDEICKACPVVVMVEFMTRP